MPRPPWSDVPVELAGLVLCRLPAIVDRVCFAAVCRQWRAAAKEVPLPPPLPLLVLPDGGGTAYSFPRSKPFRLPAFAGYAEACSGNWLAFFERDDDGRSFIMRDAFSNATVLIPSLSLTLCRYSSFVYVNDVSILFPKVTMHKLLYCSPRLVAAVVKYRNRQRIAVCRPGTDSLWSICLEHSFSDYTDMAFHKGKLYALKYFTLSAIHIGVDGGTGGDPWVSQVQPVITARIPQPYMVTPMDMIIKQMFYLVELRDALVMVRRRIYGRYTALPIYQMGNIAPVKNEFEVFQADFERSQWIKMTTIGDDQVLFLRPLCSRSVSVSQYDDMPGDRIVFLENVDEGHGMYDKGSSSYWSVYDMKDCKVSTAVPAALWKQNDNVPPTWLFPKKE